MTVKDSIYQVLENLPDSVSWDEVQYRLYVRQVVEESDRQFERGEFVTQEEVEKRMEKCFLTEARWHGEFE